MEVGGGKQMLKRSMGAVAALFATITFPGINWSQEQNADLMVRTVNTLGGDPYYPKRILGIAREFHQDWFMSIGLIGMQEAGKKMDRCPVEGEVGDASRCFGAIMRESYGGKPTTNASCF